MNFRKNNGFTAIDISISMIIILIFIPTIFGIAYNIQKTNTSVKRESTAISLATEVLEIVKSEDYDDITLSTGSTFLTDLSQKYTASDYTNTETQEDGYEYIYYQATGEDNAHYQIQIGLKNYYPSNEETDDLVKKINVLVIYPTATTQETIDISMVIQNS